MTDALLALRLHELSDTRDDAASLIRATILLRRRASLFLRLCGRSSVVEHQLPKLSVVGSTPIARSNPFVNFAPTLHCGIISF